MKLLAVLFFFGLVAATFTHRGEDKIPDEHEREKRFLFGVSNLTVLKVKSESSPIKVIKCICRRTAGKILANVR